MIPLDGFSHIKLASDLHLEVDFRKGLLWYPEEDASFKDSLLVLAGDIAPQLAFTGEWLSTIASMFHSVVIVLGNHDYWGMDFANTSAFKEAIEATPNCYLLHRAVIGNPKVKIVGATLWTNLSEQIDAYAYDNMLNDRRFISLGQRKINSSDINEEHSKDLQFISQNITKDSPDQTLIVVSHHAPAKESCDPRYEGDMLNHCFYSEYGHLIKSSDIDYWLHGHIHHAFDYSLGGCRVLCNPRGYFAGESGIECEIKHVLTL